MPATRLTAILATLVFSAAVPLAAAQQVELHLRTGSVIKGDLISEDKDQVVVKSTSIGKSGKAMSMTMPYKRVDIADLVPLGDPEVIYKTKSTAATTATDFLALAQWCREQGMVDRAAEQAKKSLTLDASQEAAKTLLSDLGWTQADGKWQQKAPEAPPKPAAADAAKPVEDKAATLVDIDRQLADLQKRSTALDASLAKANTDLGAAHTQAQKLTNAKTEVVTAQQNLDAIRKKNASSQNGAGHPTGDAFGAANILQFTEALDRAKKNLAEAQRTAGTSEAQYTQAKAKVAALTEDKKSLEKKREGLNAQRTAAGGN